MYIIIGLLICFIYTLILFSLMKLSGVKYTEIIKDSNNIVKGLVIPVGISTGLLVISLFCIGLLPLEFSQNENQVYLWYWIVPILFVLPIIHRLLKPNLKYFDKKGIIFLTIGTLLVGLSEELLFRGVLVYFLFQSGLSVFLVGLLSSIVFGVVHGMNYFNGQDKKTTLVQMGVTVIYGGGFYIALLLSGNILLPIILHFLLDLSVLLQGGELNKPSVKPNRIDLIFILLFYFSVLLAFISLFLSQFF